MSSREGVVDSIVATDSQKNAASRGPVVSKFYATTTPDKAAVFIDGENIGETPIEGINIPCGSFLVEMVKDGYEPFSRVIDFSNESVVLNEILIRRRGQNGWRDSSFSLNQDAAFASRGVLMDMNGWTWVLASSGRPAMWEQILPPKGKSIMHGGDKV